MQQTTDTFYFYFGRWRRAIILLAVGIISFGFAYAAQAGEGPNLVGNGSLELESSAGLPQNWARGRWGTNQAVFTYPVAGYQSSRAAQVEITQYTSGDAKWYPEEIAVTNGREYVFRETYSASTTSYITLRYRFSDGTIKWADMARLDSSDWQSVTRNFTVPTGVAGVTIFHLIKSVGTLTVDDFALHELSAPPPDDPANIIKNSSLESMDSSGLPAQWARGRWGTNQTVFTYPVAGYQSVRAAKVEITQYTSGDAKWYPQEVSITGNAEYRFTSAFVSTTNSYVTLRYRFPDGTIKWADIARLDAAVGWQTINKTFVTPAGAVGLTVFHLIKSVGALTVDAYELKQVAILPPPDPDNLIKNASLELADSAGLPQNWARGRWGTNQAVFTYPVAGYQSARAAKVEITQYTSGDAKWYPQEIFIKSNQDYVFSGFYQANVTSYLTLQYNFTNGATQWVDIATLAPSSSWREIKKYITAPSNVASMRILHLIKNVGTLTVDSFSLKENLGTQALVTFTFDDGWRSGYDNAVPMLNAAGLKSSHYIVTDRLSGNYPGYISAEEVLQLERSGHEVGAHTRTHSDLTKLTEEQMRNEIIGSRQNLLAAGVSAIDTFVYPFGAYNTTTDRIVKEAGYLGARTSDDGFNRSTGNKYLLTSHSVEVDVSLEEIKTWIDTALQNRTWLVMVFHRVDLSGTKYSITPYNFQQVINYLQEKNAPVVTLREGIQRLLM